MAIWICPAKWMNHVTSLHSFYTETSEIAMNQCQRPQRQNRHQNRSSLATGYVCVKVARVFSQRLGNFLCQYWMIIILSAPML